MPRIVVKGDNLNELNANFVQQRLLEPVFLNSVPKCGTHLVRNIMRMFAPVDQQYHQAFIQHAILRQHQVAFSQAMPHLSWGHLLFSDEAAIVLHHVHHVVQIRDPYDWVLARTRFFLSDTFQGSLEHLKGGNVSVDEVMNMMIFGIHGSAPSMNDIFTHNAVSWLGTKIRLLRFEDLLQHVKKIDRRGGVFFCRFVKGLRNGRIARGLARTRSRRVRSPAKWHGAGKSRWRRQD